MTADLHTLVGAYALDALTAEEHEQFEQHLATCANCRAELAELRATAARLSDTTVFAPPPGIKARLMDAIASTQQDRPRVAIPAATPRRRMTSVLLAAAAALAVMVSLGAFFVERARLADLQQERATVASVLSAPDVQQRSTRLENGGTVRMIMSPSLDQAVVAMQDLPALKDDQSYQMWRVRRGGPESAAVLSVDGTTDSVTVLVGDLDDTESIAVTVEPAGGSPRPTSEPVATIAVT
jgi:anti-sigma-K factor RskA